MAKRIFGFLNKELNGVNEAALFLGGFAFLSQILGLIRDRMLASIVGAGPTLDIYYAAFRIPDFVYISIASLASVTVLMPFIVKKLDNEGKEKAQEFMNHIFSSFMIFMVLASIILIVFMPVLVRYVAPGFSESQFKLMIDVSRIMLLSPIFIGLSNLIGTITQLYKRFFIFSLSPVFYNLGILSGIIFLYPILGIHGLALGVILGAILHFLIQVPVVARYGFIPRFIYPINWVEVWRVARLSLPRTLALSCNSLAFIALISMASNLKEGSISLFTFSFNLQSVPVGIIGISYSVAAFPVLVKSFSVKDMNNFINQIIQTARQIVFWSFPTITLLIVLRAQIVRVILGSNTFTWFDTRLTAAAVALFVISLASQGLVLLFVRGYYASGNTKKPLFINVFSSLMMIVFAHILIYIFKNYPEVLSRLEVLLRVKNVPGTIMLALPMAYTLGSLLNFSLVWILFKKEFLHGMSSKLWTTFIQSGVGALVMGFVTYLSLGIFDDVFGLSTFYGVFLQGFVSGIIGIAVGVLVLLLFKNKELDGVIKAIGHKFSRDKILAPEQTEL